MRSVELLVKTHRYQTERDTVVTDTNVKEPSRMYGMHHAGSVTVARPFGLARGAVALCPWEASIGLRPRFETKLCRAGFFFEAYWREPRRPTKEARTRYR